jgi:hypothetical protein
LESREYHLNILNTTVTSFLEICQDPEVVDIEVYAGWTTKDVLCHITFWHESFARNVDDLVHNRKPKPLKGRFIDLNQQGVEAIRPYPIVSVCERLKNAHAVIQKNILNPALLLIPYKIGSRAYSPEEHMDIVSSHIQEHGRDIQKAVQLVSNSRII